jgi:hypothetical protein
VSERHRWLPALAKAVIIIAVTLALFRATGLQLAELDFAELAHIRPSPALLAASTLALLVVYLAHAFLWRQILGDVTGLRMRPGVTVRIYFLASLGRYLPGKIWQVAGMALLSQRAGLPAVSATASAILGQLLFLLAGVAFVAIVLPGWLGPAPILAALGAIVLLAGGAYLVGTQRGGAPTAAITAFLRNRLGARLDELVRLLRGIRPRHLPGWLVAYAASWLLLGAAFALFAVAFAPAAASSVRFLAGSIAAAYLVGYAAFFAPAGLGFREGVLGLLLANVMPAPTAVIVAVASRLWFTLAELIPLVALPFLAASRSPDQPPGPPSLPGRSDPPGEPTGLGHGDARSNLMGAP